MAVTLEIDAEIEAQVRRLADARHQSPAGLVSEAVRQFVLREQRREQMQNDSLAAWRDYQATGLHLTYEEADAWLEKLEAGLDVEPPPCHV